MIDVKKYKDSKESSNGLFKGILIALTIFLLITVAGKIFSGLFDFIEISALL